MRRVLLAADWKESKRRTRDYLLYACHVKLEREPKAKSTSVSLGVRVDALERVLRPAYWARMSV